MARPRLLLAVAATAACALFGVTQAAAAPSVVSPHTATVLTTGSAGGSSVPAGATVTGTLAPGTQWVLANMPSGTPTFKISCATSSLTAQVLGDPTAPGTASLSVTALSIGTCAIVTGPGVSGVSGITALNLPYAASMASGGSVTVSGVGLSVGLQTVLGAFTCVYSAPTVNGTQSNTDSGVAFAAQLLTKSSGSSLCPAQLYLTAKYVLSSGAAPLFVN